MAIVYTEEYKTKLQERLSVDTKWKDIANVEYTDTMTLHNPYMTDGTAVDVVRGTGYDPTAVATTDDTVSINAGKLVAQYIDRADLAQKTFSGWMEIADRQGILLNEAIEAGMYANFADYTTFDNTAIGGGAGNITVSDTNIDDIIRGVKRKIREANGETLLERNGGFFVWRPADFEKLEAYAQANGGYIVNDSALKNGTSQGFTYMGMTHYSSSKLVAGKLFAGVKKVLHLGICKSTYGQINEIQDPVVSGKQISGIGINSRVDFKFKAWSQVKPVLFNILVA